VKTVFVVALLILWHTQPASAQGRAMAGKSLEHGTLSECIHFALNHQPLVRQSLIDEAITEKTISSKLADWYPQLNFGFNVQHDPELPTSIVQGNPVKLGLQNTSGGQLVLSQTLFDRDVLLASSTADEVRRESSEQTVSAKIDVVVNVSKAYYAVLATLEQIDLLDEDIVRLQQSLNDALNQYKSGVVDKTDYQRATIALNNARAEKVQNEELLTARYASLKNQMGYPASAGLKLEYNVATMEREAMLDTTQSLNPANRIEYQIFTTQRSLQEASIDYQEWGFLPTVTAYGAYNLSFQNNEFAQLYGRDYPNSNLGLQLSFPIFQGGKRLQEIAAAKLQLERSENDIVALDNSIQAEFSSARAAYRSNLNDYRVLKENLALAKDVYQTIELQYKAGTKTYLDVITAETDLRTAQANETDALYEVLSSKLDVEKALGTVHY
jgi:outer membrane protein